MGLTEKIKAATSEKQILSLIEEGLKFNSVSAKTKRRWGYVAKRRIAELLKPVAKKKESAEENATKK